MKKAIEYLEEFEKKGLMSSITLTELILEVQRDTIDEVVRICAEKNKEVFNFKSIDETEYSVEMYGHIILPYLKQQLK